MSETRTRVMRHVEANPGVHFNAISRELDIATGQTQYHVRKLLREGGVISEQVCGRTHYFADGYSETERAAIALLRRETTREVVFELLRQDGMSPDDLADRVGVVRSTVEWHLSNLLDNDLAEKRYNGREVTVHLAEPELLKELLVTVDPTVADRLVDRFTRLVDGLLESPHSSER